MSFQLKKKSSNLLNQLNKLIKYVFF